MIVTFVGGPWHGRHEQRDDVPNRIWADDPNSETGKFLYELRQQTGSGVSTNPIVWSHTIYAPVGISIEEFFQISKEVPIPFDLL